MPHRKRSKKHISTGVEQLVRELKEFPWLFSAEPNLKSVCVFLAGYDAAFGGAALFGLHQWLILKKVKNGDGIFWARNLVAAATAKAGRSAPPDKVLQTGYRLLDDFFKYRQKRGAATIFDDYVLWRQKGRRRVA